MNDNEATPEYVLTTINNCLVYKNSARKSYIRTKVLGKNFNDDITQLCYLLHEAKTTSSNNTENNIINSLKQQLQNNEVNHKQELETQRISMKHLIATSKERITRKTDYNKMEKETEIAQQQIDLLKKQIKDEQEGCEYITNRNTILEQKLDDSRIEIESLRQRLEFSIKEKKEVYKPIVNNNDKIEIEDLKKINERLVKRIHNGDFDNPTDKDITIRKLKEDIENMKQQHKMELLLDEQNMLNDLNKI